MPDKLMNFELNPDGKTVNIINKDGTKWHSVPKEDAPNYVASGDWFPMTKEQRIATWKIDREQRIKEEYGEKSLEAAIEGFGSGLTLGLKDYLAPDYEKEHLRRLEEENPTANVIGEIGSYFVPFGAVNALGKIGVKAGTSLAKKIAAKGLSRSLKSAGKLAGAVEAQLVKNGVANIAAKDIASKFVKDVAEKSLATKAINVIEKPITKAIATGAVEGAAIETQQQIKDFALYNKPIQPVDIAKSALVGGAFTIGVSLAGKGLKKAHKKIAPLIYKEERKLYNLKGQKAELEAELTGYSGVDDEIERLRRLENATDDEATWASAFTERLNKQKDKVASDTIRNKIDNVGKRILDVEKKINKTEQAYFKNYAARTLSRGVLGGVLGYAKADLLGATIGYVSGTLLEKTSKAQYNVLRKIYDKTTAETLSKLAHNVSKLSTASTIMLTKDDLKEMKKELDSTNINKTRKNAYIGYREAGVPKPLSEDFANIHAKNLEVLKLYFPKNIGDLSQRISFSKIYGAVEKPASIIAKINSGTAMEKDLLVFQMVYPEVWNRIQEEAKYLIENKEDELSYSQKNMIKKILGKNNTLFFQQLQYAPQQETTTGKQSSSKINIQNTGQTSLQKARQNIGG